MTRLSQEFVLSCLHPLNAFLIICITSSAGEREDPIIVYAADPDGPELLLLSLLFYVTRALDSLEHVVASIELMSNGERQMRRNHKLNVSYA
jgi:hypothetical protein